MTNEMNRGSEPAFPTGRIKGTAAGYDIVLNADNPGLTKREYFAAMAMQGIVTNLFNCAVSFAEKNEGKFKQPMPEAVAIMSATYADALLARLEHKA